MVRSSHPDNGDLSRDPCPLVILSDVGYAFAVGAGGSILYYGFKGFKNSPYGERFQGITSAIRVQAPIKAGNFGTWGGLYGFFDCSVRHFRSTEDIWTSVLAGGFTGGTLAIRGGWKSFRTNFIFGAVALGVIDGMQIALMHYMAQPHQAPMLPNAQ